MAQEYTVKDVKTTGQQDDHGNDKLWVSFEEVQDNAFMIAKKLPERGQKEYGELKKETSKAGKEYYRFKRVQREDGQSSNSFKGSEKREWVDNSDSIVAQSAVKSATQVYAGTGADYGEVERMARNLHSLIIELSDPKAKALQTNPPVVMQGKLDTSSGYETFKAAGGNVKSQALAEDQPPASAYDDLINSSQEINLDEIPF